MNSQMKRYVYRMRSEVVLSTGASPYQQGDTVTNLDALGTLLFKGFMEVLVYICTID